MEAVPRLPMLSLELKSSPEAVSFGPKLKQYIAECYREDPDSYNGEIHQLEGLRSAAVRASVDGPGLLALKRYFYQLRGIQSRFPMSKGQPVAVNFAWRDLFANIVCNLADIRFEMVCVLYNIGAMHTVLGANETRTTPESMKAACTNFQNAVWVFQHLKEHFPQPLSVDLSPDVMKLFQDICLGQAQECILEKSMQDNRKPAIVAAIGMQAIQHYKSALAMMDTSQNTDTLHETVGLKTCSLWSKSVSFKIAYIGAIVNLFQGMQSEEQQKMGERVAYYQLASDKLQLARKRVKGLSHADAINEALTFTNDVVEGKRKAAKNENEFIYHEEVPDKDLLTDPKPAALAEGIAINFTDSDALGPDIFSRLVPMRAHEASSMYSEEKAKLLRKVCGAVEAKDSHLNDFMSSLQLDELNVINDTERIPQELVEICAALSVKSDVIKELVDSMNTLADIHTEVENMFTDIKTLIQEEETNEKEFQQIMGKRPPSNVTTELNREVNKYLEAHNKANESNQTLHKAMTLHLANLKLLLLPLDELERHVPSVESIKASIDNAAVSEMRSLVEKVNEMRAQRSMLVLQLREAVNSDDITSQLLTRTDETLETIFLQEIDKHNKSVALIDQNMLAQENILKALTDAYAKYAPSRKIISDVLRKKESFFTAMTTSYETYDDLMKKSSKGIEFYRKLSSTVSRLLSRLKSMCGVQQDERTMLLTSHTQKLTSATPKVENVARATPPLPPPVEKESTGPKLKDYLPYMKNRNAQPVVSDPPIDMSGQMYPPYVRPAPVGSEGTNDPTPSKYFDSNRQYEAESQKNYQYPMQFPEQTTYAYGAMINQNPVDPKSYPASSTGYAYQNYPTDNVAYPEQKLPEVKPAENIQYAPNTAMNYPEYTYPNQQVPQDPYQNQTIPNYANYQQMYPDQNDPNNLATQMQAMNVAYPNVPYSGYYDPNQYQNVQANMYAGVQPTPDMTYNTTAYNPALSSAINVAVPTPDMTYNTAAYNPAPSPAVSGAVPNPDMTYNSPAYNPASSPAVSAAVPTPDMTYNATAYNPAPSPAVSSALPAYSAYNTDQTNMVPDAQNMGYQTNQMANAYPNNYYQNMYSMPQQSVPNPEVPPIQNPEINTIQSHVAVYNNQYNTPYVSTEMPPMDPNAVAAPSPNVSVDSYQNHPGYCYNNKTGAYDYNYGYQNATQNSQNTENLDYSNVNPQTNIYTNAGTYATVQTASTPVSEQNMAYNNTGGGEYYSLPYGHQSADSKEVPNQVSSPNQTNANNLTYMNSQDSMTTTTQSGQGRPEITSSSSTESPEPSAIDLLSGLDFTISHEPLMPEIRVPPVSEHVIRKTPLKESSIDKKADKPLEPMIVRPAKRDLFADPGLVNKFTQEVKSMQQFVDGLTKKTHSGITMLDSKWKKIQDTQAKEHSMKTCDVAKVNQAKNASPDVLTYDDSRVQFPDEFSDSYINASHIKQISSWCIPMIISDLPSDDNYDDFWHMILHEKVSSMVCLLTEIELQGKFYGPTTKNTALTFASGLSVALDDVACNINWTVRKFIISYKNVKHKLTHFQIHTFPARIVSAPLVMLVDKILETEDENDQNIELPKVLVHCSSGAGRSALIILLTMVICQVRAGYVDLREMLDAGFIYLCGIRTNVLEDTKYLVDIYRTVLFYVQGVLCSGTVMFNGEAVSVPSGASVPPPHIPVHSKKTDINKFSKESFEEMKQAAGLKSGDMQDPLSYLDPMWSLKKRKD